MPLYDYKCPDHGLFHELATLADSAQPAPCPQCGVLAARVILLPSQLRQLEASERAAHDHNEKARHQPVLSTPDYRAEQQARREHKHGKGCGCGDKPIRKSNLLYTADGNKMFPSMRPWMISH